METAWLERTIKWIAASNSLPQKGVLVLGVALNGQVNAAFLSNKGKWRWAHGDTATNITHWKTCATISITSTARRVCESANAGEKASRRFCWTWASVHPAITRYIAKTVSGSTAKGIASGLLGKNKTATAISPASKWR